MKPIVVIMAAGMGSRYGGLKQIDPVGPNGEIIIDYSIYAARQAGFERFIFIIKEENRRAFEEVLTTHLPEDLEVRFAYQKIEDLPDFLEIPEGRTKPWGTAHAIYAARGLIDAPFMVINADDYYGKDSFQLMYDFLQEESKPGSYAMVAYKLAKTLTENGSVSRGVCEIRKGMLEKVVERTEIYSEGKGGKFTEDGGESFTHLPEETYVSMNFWGFQLDFLEAIQRDFSAFFKEKVSVNPLKAEFYLPTVVTNQLEGFGATVKVLPTEEAWMGVTYPQDKQTVQEGFKKFVEDGLYPSPLW